MDTDSSSTAIPPDSHWPEAVMELRQLVQERRLTKETFNTDSFQALWERVRDCLNSVHAYEFWVTVSALGRAASVSKPAENLVNAVLAKRFEKPLPEFVNLPDGEDRFYLAKSLEQAKRDETSAIAFSQLASEETAEKARRVWLRLASSSVPSLAIFLAKLNQEIERTTELQNLSADSICRRLRRINSVIDDFLATSELEAGETFGKEVRWFYLLNLPASGPETKQLRDDCAKEFMISLSKLVRLNFAASTEPLVFEVIYGLRDWWRPASPSIEFETQAHHIAKLGVRTLHAFAKQGVKNKPLREALVSACGEPTLRRLTQAIAESDLSLEEGVSHWFIHGVEAKEIKSVRSVDALSLAKLDEYIARLLISVTSSDFDQDTMEQAIDQVKDIMPDEAEVFASSSSRIGQIKQWANAIARSRRISLTPERAAIVAYDPSVHSGSNKINIGSKVLVRTSGAAKQIEGRPSVILVKAEVDRLYGQ